MTLHLAETAKERLIVALPVRYLWERLPLPAFLPTVLLAVFLAVGLMTEMSAHYLQVLPALVLSAALCH